MQRSNINSVIGITVFALGIMLASCSALLLDQTVLAQAKDSVAPVVTIISPDAGYLCANLVEVSGVATDATNDGSAGRVASLKYEVPGSLIAGNVIPSDDGSFVILLKTDSFQSGFSLKVTAEDWNGNSASEGLALARLPSSSLPSFTAVGSNKTVVLTWDIVPETESYTIYYTSNGALPSETVGTRITEATSPYSIPCDDNGLLYTFRIKASAKSGNPDSLSDFVRAIPLSDQTLCPDVISGRGELTISWKEIAATNEFEIYRRVGEDGDYSFFRRVIGYESVDSLVETGEHYYYSIKPRENSDLMSAAGVCQTDGFALRNEMTTIKAVTLMYPTLTWRDNLLYAAGRGGLQILHPDLAYYELARISKTVVYQAVTPEASRYLYLAAGTDGFLIYDVYNPTMPINVGSYTGAGIDIRGIVLDPANSRAWVASYCKTVYCLDISDPTNPSLVKSFPLDRTDAGVLQTDIGTEFENFPDLDPIDMILSDEGAYLYVGNRKGGLQIFSTSAITDTCSIRTVTEIAYPDCSVVGLTAKAKMIFACYASRGVKAIDITDPLSASIVGTSTSDYNSRYTDIAVDGNTAFATSTGTGIEVFDISNPNSLQLIRTIPTIIGYGGFGTHSLALKDGFAYIFHHKSSLNEDDSKSLFKVDLNTPVGIGMTSSVDVPGATGIAIQGDYAYVAAGESGLKIYDITTLQEPKLLSSTATVDPAYKVFVKANRAYVIVNYQYYYSSHIEVFEVSDPVNPIKLGTLLPNGMGQIQDLEIRGDYAFAVGNYDVGLSIFDISNPSATVLVGHYGIPFKSTDISLSGKYALIAGGEKTISVYDIGDPLNATLVKTLSGENPIQDFSMSGGYGFFTMQPASSGAFKMVIRDLKDPTDVDTGTDKEFSYPGVSFNDDEWMDAVAGLGTYAVVSTLEVNSSPSVARLRIYDFSEFSQSRLISELVVDDFVDNNYTEFNHELQIAGSVIYALGTDGRLRIYDMRP